MCEDEEYFDIEDLIVSITVTHNGQKYTFEHNLDEDVNYSLDDSVDQFIDNIKLYLKNLKNNNNSLIVN